VARSTPGSEGHFGYDAVLTFPRRRDFYDYDDYLEALAKWKASIQPNEQSRAV
jgi:hypothetical protein